MQDEVFRLKSNMTFLEFLSNSNMFGVQIPETVFHAPEFKKMIWPQNAYSKGHIGVSSSMEPILLLISTS